MSYNIRYNWIRWQLNRLDRKKARIYVHEHAIEKEAYENLTVSHILETVKTGKVAINKCEYPEKICFKRYFGKEKRSCVVITRFEKRHIKAITIWQTAGN